MEILYIFADFPYEKNTSLHNCERPTKAINDANIGHHASFIHFTQFVENSQETQDLCSRADIIIIERNLFQDVLVLATYWKVRGKTIMCIFDDGFGVIEKTNPTYEFWKFGKVKGKDKDGNIVEGEMIPHPLEQMKWGLQMSVGLQTVSHAIADYWRFATDTYVVHNNIFFDDYQNKEPLYKHPGTILIGWSGSLSHHFSFQGSGISRAYRKICQKYPNVKILIAGDQKTYELIDAPKSKKIFQPFVPDEHYPALLKTFDILTIPLSGEYDKCRSQIKPLEAMACGVPAICSNYPNYNHLAEYTNFTENGWENWFNAISEAIENLPQYKERAMDVGVPFAKTQDYSLHVQERIDLYQHVIEKGYNREQS